MKPEERETEERYDKEFDDYALLGAGVMIAGTAIGAATKVAASGLKFIGDRKYNKAKKKFDESLEEYYKHRDSAKQTILELVNLKKYIMRQYAKAIVRSYRRLDPAINLLRSPGLKELKLLRSAEPTTLAEIRDLSKAYSSYNPRRLGEKAVNVAILMVQDGRATQLAVCMKDIIRAGKINDAQLKRIRTDDFKIQAVGILAEFGEISVEYAFSGIADVFNSVKELQQKRVAAKELICNKEILDNKALSFRLINMFASDNLMLLKRYSNILSDYVPRSVRIIKEKDNFFHFGRISESKFTEDEIGFLAVTFAMMESAKAIIDSPVIDKDGDVYYNNDKQYKNAVKVINTYETLPYFS